MAHRAENGAANIQRLLDVNAQTFRGLYYLRPVAMNLKTLVAFVLLILAGSASNAQWQSGPRSVAMGGTSLTRTDAWSVFSNQGAMAFSETWSAAAFFENRFSVSGLSDKGAAARIPLGNGVAGVVFRSFGNHLYAESKAGLGYGLRLSEKFGAGVQANYINYALGEGYGSRYNVTVDAGLYYRMNQHVSLAAHLANPTRAQLNDYNNERIPTLLRLGCGWKISDQVNVAAEAWQWAGTNAQFRAGVEYEPTERIAVRLGTSTGPGTMSFGFGYKVKGFAFDVGTAWHQVLGFSPQLGLSFSPDPKP
ncbi:MAG: hypothetical protein JNM00_13475 [Flavobacteriales bacterium]|nr:hypothetical protein [Flavobacteriales bacterium]